MNSLKLKSRIRVRSQSLTNGKTLTNVPNVNLRIILSHVRTLHLRVCLKFLFSLSRV